MKTCVLFFFLSIFFLFSCTKVNEETFLKNSQATCDTTSIKFSATVLPIIKANCYSCHGNGLVSGGINFDTYSQIKNHANSDLLQAISWLPGYPQMPENAAKLAQCDIDKIAAWIHAGSPNN